MQLTGQINQLHSKLDYKDRNKYRRSGGGGLMNTTMDTFTASARTNANTSGSYSGNHSSLVPSANSTGRTYYFKHIHNENYERLQAA